MVLDVFTALLVKEDHGCRALVYPVKAIEVPDAFSDQVPNMLGVLADFKEVVACSCDPGAGGLVEQ